MGTIVEYLLMPKTRLPLSQEKLSAGKYCLYMVYDLNNWDAIQSPTSCFANFSSPSHHPHTTGADPLLISLIQDEAGRATW